MKKKPLYLKLKNLFSCILLIIFVSCGSFQGSSYFASDGIYFSQSKTGSENSKAVSKNNYYQQYFKDAATNGYVETNEENTYFTDTNSYNSNVEYIDNATLENGNSQIPWGGETSQTEIILANTFPTYSWGLASFGFGYSPFWNNYYSNPYRFGYGGFYGSFRNDPYWNISSGYAGMFGGFNSFYSPFDYYGGFYNPFGYGFRNGYRNNWGNRWNRFNDYYGDNLDQRNKRDYSSTVARINSGRGEKTYDNPKERTREKTENTDSKTRDIQNTLDRLNLGRGVNSTNRNLVIGYDRNRTENNTNNLNSIKNIRPGGTFNSLTRDTRRTQLNTNLTKSPQGLSRASGRVQNQYSLVERNPDRFSSSRDRRPSSSQGVVSSRNSENSRSSTRIVRRPNRNKTKNTSNYSNSRTRRSNNFSRSNNSYSNNRNSNRSYNSGGSGSAVRSVGSSGGRGRTN